jgi:hypothetical protein
LGTASFEKPSNKQASSRTTALRSISTKLKKKRPILAKVRSSQALGDVGMATKTDKQRSARQYSTTNLWIGLIAALLLLAILLESACLSILYVNDVLKGNDTSRFAEQHLLTRLFVSTPPNPVPGKHFLGRLTFADAGWGTPFVADSLLGYRMRSAISVFYVAPSAEYLYITDDNGFSVDADDPPITLQKPADVYRVIVLGGSTVMGAGAPRPSQNIVGMLREGARARGLAGPNGKRLEFINAGVDGYSSAQEYLYLVSDLLRFKPDLVVVYDGWNDLVYDFDNNLSPFRTTHMYIRSRVAESFSIAGSVFLVAQNVKEFLSSSSFRLGVIELARRVFDRFRSRADIVHSLSVPFDPRNIEFYDINRRAFLALADNQLSVALFLQPLVGVDDRMLSAEEKASWWYPTHDRVLRNRVPFYERARQILAHLKASEEGGGYHCIADLSHSLKGVFEPVYADTGHLLPKGNEVVAAQILDQLVLCGLIR